MIPNSIFTSFLVLLASFLNLFSRLVSAVSPFFSSSPSFSASSKFLDHSFCVQRIISLPDTIHHLMMSRRSLAATSQSGGVHPSLSRSFTITLESFSISRTQEVAALAIAELKGVDPLLSFALTSMSGCARSNGITGDRWLS